MSFDFPIYPRMTRRPDAESLVNLHKRRAWYTDDKNPGGSNGGSGEGDKGKGGGEGDKGGDGKEGGDSDDDGEGDKGGKKLEDLTSTELAELLREQRRENAAARRKLREREQADADAEAERKRKADEALAQQGEYQKLAEQRAQEIADLKPYKERAEKAEKALQAHVDARIARIPQDKRSLVPKGIDVYQQSEWLDLNESLLVKPGAPNLNPGGYSGGEGNGKAELRPASY